MRRILTILFAVFVQLTSTAHAAPLDAATQAQLLGIFDAYNAALKKGDLKAAMALRDQESRKSFEASAKTAKARQDLLGMARSMVPNKLDVSDTSLLGGGTEAEIEAIATLIAPPRARGRNGVPKDGVVKQPVTLGFKQEDGSWKFTGPTYGFAPANSVPCDENKAETEAAFDDNSNLSIGGLIRRVKFADNYTAIVIDVVGEENCLYLPNREVLRKAGLNTDLLVAKNLVEAKGHRHKSDKQRAWLTDMTVTVR